MKEIMESIGEPVLLIMIVLGAIVSLISTIGLLRFPDVYTRSHGVSKSSTLGVLLILLGSFLYFAFFEGHASAKLILGIIFVFLTAPVGGHLISRAAYRTGVPLTERTVQEQLKDAVEAFEANEKKAKERE
ncbi:monovalent cation/H(+) antiporter subunit G [Marinicrinis lubricantis]|uniref:Monovalent cation/H(+) antiporter subunit G n=1 Tax=Marinicrinis lubricantis TaxID=2086470 RepID=A0ABW1IKF8_9BACL